MRWRAWGRRFVSGWGLPIAAAVFWAIVFFPSADYDVKVNRGAADPEQPVSGTSTLLLLATVVLIVAVGQKLIRRFRAAR